MDQKKFSILISTKNRKSDLLITLNTIAPLLNEDVECVVFDDGSDDGTAESVLLLFPQIIFWRNEISKGYLYCRNKMLNETSADFAVSLDDDANFVTADSLENIAAHFSSQPKCGLIAFRLLWQKDNPNEIESNEIATRVKGFVGCGHVWRMEAWNDIPNYPEWFKFYGEEEFASYQLFKKGWEVHYLPSVLVHHRVDLKLRKLQKDYTLRLRRSLSSGWNLYLLFLPKNTIPRKLAYSIWMQLKLKVFKGDLKAFRALMSAVADVSLSLPKAVQESNRFTVEEFQEYSKLTDTKIYWIPEKR